MKNILKPVFYTSVGIMILTIMHHGYGAAIYDEPFRLHVAFIAVPVIFTLYVSFRFYQKQPQSISGKIAFWIYMIVAIVFPIGVIGLYEGGYNHLLKNILFFTGSSQELLVQLFPPPTYEMPNDFLFESTGILQFFMACMAIWYFFKPGTAYKSKLPEVSVQE